ncbi:MAG: hypothetical protein ABIS26_02625 [Candidatus Paceibacterota bacterium]
MDQEIKNLERKIDEQVVKIDAIYKSVEKTRKYFLMMIWITVIAVVLPMIGLAFVLPAFLNSYLGSLNSLGI